MERNDLTEQKNGNMPRSNFLLSAAVALCCICISDNIGAENVPGIPAGITAENYPRVDGSTSTEPLNTLIACKLLGWRYEWKPYLVGNGIWRLEPHPDDAAEGFFGERIKSSQTHNSIINLIDGQTDIVISARKMSDDEQTYAQSVGIDLTGTPVALDALDFIVNRQNPVQSLTAQQIRDIYLGNITNWSEVGGKNEPIRPFIRNANSGSQEMMKEIVMNHAGMSDWETGFDDDVITTMARVFTEIADHPGGICFTPHYYREYIIRDAVGSEHVKSIAIDGVTSDAGSINDKTYPFVADVYALIRSDTDRGSTAFKIYEWLQTQAGRRVIAESGYVPAEAEADGGAEPTETPAVRIFPNPVTDGFRITGLTQPAQLTVTDISGRLLLSRPVAGSSEYVHAASWPKGLYVAVVSTGKSRVAVKIVKKRNR